MGGFTSSLHSPCISTHHFVYTRDISQPVKVRDTNSSFQVSIAALSNYWRLQFSDSFAELCCFFRKFAAFRRNIVSRDCIGVPLNTVIPYEVYLPKMGISAKQYLSLSSLTLPASISKILYTFFDPANDFRPSVSDFRLSAIG